MPSRGLTDSRSRGGGGPEKRRLGLASASEAATLLEAWARDPVRFVRDALGGDPWSKQVQILEAVRDNKRVAVRSGHGLGKTRCAAYCVLYWLYTHPGSIVITTAPSWHQVENLLWREIRAAHEAAPLDLAGQRFVTRLELATDWYAIGLSTDLPERFQGFHSEHILLVVDEASGVNQAIFSAAEGFLTTPGARVLLIGNPTQLSGEFYQAFRSPLYHKIHISAYDSPNVTGEGDRPYLVSPEWIEDHRRMWGEESPLWYSRVLGQFPEQAEDALIPLSWIEQSMQREAPEAVDAPCILGVDVARHGSDASVIAVRRGDSIVALQRTRKQDTMTVAGWVIDHARRHGASEVRVDADGLGAGVYDRLKEQGIPAVEMRGGMQARDAEQFANCRAEWYWGLRERLDPGQGGTAALPRDEVLLGQLAGLKVQYTSRGQVKIESKDDMRRRGLPSPDEADAIMYAFAAMYQPRSAVIGAKQSLARVVMPETVTGVQAGVMVKSTQGGLPIPVAPRSGHVKAGKGVKCPQCQELLTIHQGTRWLCREHGWHDVAPMDPNPT